MIKKYVALSNKNTHFKNLFSIHSKVTNLTLTCNRRINFMKLFLRSKYEHKYVFRVFKSCKATFIMKTSLDTLLVLVRCLSAHRLQIQSLVFEVTLVAQKLHVRKMKSSKNVPSLSVFFEVSAYSWSGSEATG